MKKIELMRLANRHYSDGFLSTYYDLRNGEPQKGTGDTLAQFVVFELSECFPVDCSDEEQILDSIRLMNQAMMDLQSVISGLEEGLDE